MVAIIVNNEDKKINLFYFLTFALFVSIFFQRFYLEMGFALKPFFIFSIIIFIVFIKKFNIAYLNKFEVFLLLYFTYYSITGLFAKYSFYSLRLIIGIFIIFFFYFVIRFVLYHTKIKNIENIIVKSGLIFNTSSLILFILGALKVNFVFNANNVYHLGMVIDRGSPRLIGTIIDPNIFVLFNSLFFFYFLGRVHKVGLLLSSLSLILTFSRGGLIGIVVSLILGLFLYKGKQAFKTISLFAIIISSFTFLISSIFKIDFIEIFSDRFSSLGSDKGSGRFEIWSNGLSIFSDNPLFGVGIFNFQQYNLLYFNDYHYLHNTYLEVLVESGLIGLALYLLSFIFLIYQLYKMQKAFPETRFLFQTMVAIIIIMANLSVIINEFLFMFFALCFRYLYEFREKGEKNV